MLNINDADNIGTEQPQMICSTSNSGRLFPEPSSFTLSETFFPVPEPNVIPDKQSNLITSHVSERESIPSPPEK